MCTSYASGTNIHASALSDACHFHLRIQQVCRHDCCGLHNFWYHTYLLVSLVVMLIEHILKLAHIRFRNEMQSTWCGLYTSSLLLLIPMRIRTHTIITPWYIIGISYHACSWPGHLNWRLRPWMGWNRPAWKTLLGEKRATYRSERHLHKDIDHAPTIIIMTTIILIITSSSIINTIISIIISSIPHLKLSPEPRGRWPRWAFAPGLL